MTRSRSLAVSAARARAGAARTPDRSDRHTRSATFSSDRATGALVGRASAQ